MANGMYTFSASKPTDMDLMEQIRFECQKKGVKFSWYCIQALTQYHEAEVLAMKESSNAREE